MESCDSHADRFVSRAAFDAVIEHWSKSRIDSAIAVIGRYDDAAKQLIVLGGVLQGVYFASFAFGNLDEKLSILWALPLFVPVVLTIFCAAQVICRFHLDMEAMHAYRLMLAGRLEGLALDQLTAAMDTWCKSIDGVAARKRLWLHLANSLFVFATFFALLALLMQLYRA